MFTGIVEEVGKLEAVQNNGTYASFQIGCKKILEGLKIGDSILTNGVCLTATSVTDNYFTCDAMHETMRKTGFAQLQTGSPLNLERALPVNGRLDGHIVSGHIDGTGKIREIRRDGNAIWFFVEAGENILNHMVDKGSIAMDGISLTVVEVKAREFSVSCIPHTLEVTNLHSKKRGDLVNLECDIIGKYVEKFVRLGALNKENKAQDSTLSKSLLFENGFL